jgi:hypothetical protein
VNGTVADILGRPVAGASVRISHQGQQIQMGATDGAGKFSLEIDFGEAGNVDVVTEHPDFEPSPLLIQISNFEPAEEDYSITLVPRDLSGCVGMPGSIVVGKFLPPVSLPNANLTGHVHRVLSYRILTGLQAQQLRDQLDPDKRHLVPQFLKCEGAAPATEAQGPALARALGGYGLVWGAVGMAQQGFDVDASVADAGGLFDPPIAAASHDVDLDHPREAAISPLARTAILIGIMANLESAGQCRAAIHVSNLVRAMTPDSLVGNVDAANWQRLVTADDQIRERCQQSLPDAGLLAGGLQ